MPIPAVSQLTIEDIDHLMVIERQSFPQPWSRHMYVMDLTTNGRAGYLVMRADPADNDRLPPVLAYGGFWLMVDEAHIATIATHPDWRGCGLGHHLLLALLDEAIERGAVRSTLEVRVGNTVAQRLYERLGYRRVGTRRRYYQDGEDAWIMTTPSLTEPDMQALLAQQHAASRAWLQKCFGPVSRPAPNAADRAQD